MPLATRPGGSALTVPPRRLALAAELLLVYLGLPLALRHSLLAVPRLVVLAAVTAGCLALLLADPTFPRARLWSLDGLRAGRRALAGRAALAALVVTVAVFLLDGSRWLDWPRQRPLAWALAMLLYPFLSAWPQEVVYRAWFFHRYAPLLGDGRLLVAANGLAFAALHLVYPNLVAPLLSLPAGLLLAATYRRSGTVGPAWLEHVAYGALVFTLGLGRYFYDGRP